MTVLSLGERSVRYAKTDTPNMSIYARRKQKTEILPTQKWKYEGLAIEMAKNSLHRISLPCYYAAT